MPVLFGLMFGRLFAQMAFSRAVVTLAMWAGVVFVGVQVGTANISPAGGMVMAGGAALGAAAGGAGAADRLVAGPARRRRDRCRGRGGKEGCSMHHTPPHPTLSDRIVQPSAKIAPPLAKIAPRWTTTAQLPAKSARPELKTSLSCPSCRSFHLSCWNHYQAQRPKSPRNRPLRQKRKAPHLKNLLNPLTPLP